MAKEYVLENGQLKEVETKTVGETFTASAIAEAIAILSDRISSQQAELAVWQTRKTKLEELVAG
jgi:hypothetical protein|tara:strand:- start:608 stop:799 length:192 start_codon:yes stop_codon:yes gene_type:complete